MKNVEEGKGLRTRNVSLPAELDAYATELIDRGTFGNYSEVVRHALRVLKMVEEERQVRLELARRNLLESKDQVSKHQYGPLTSL